MESFSNDEMLNAESSLSFDDTDNDFNTTQNVFDEYMYKNASIKSISDGGEDIDNEDYISLASNTSITSYLPLNDNTKNTSLTQTSQSYSLNQTMQYSNEFLNSVNRFQFLLLSPTSPAVKVTEPTLTYLNQEQNYEFRLMYHDLSNKPVFPHMNQVNKEAKNKQFIDLKSINKCELYVNDDINSNKNPIFLTLVRLCFWDHKLQERERERIKQWEKEYQKKILEVDMSNSGDIDVRICSKYSNALEIIWSVDSGNYRTINLKFNCTSTAFAKNKHGGEKGVHLRLQIDTYEVLNGSLLSRKSLKNTNDTQNIHQKIYDQKNFKFLCSSFCRIQLFRLKGAQRKLKLDVQKIERSKLAEDIRRKYQKSDPVTCLQNISYDQLYSLVPFETIEQTNQISNDIEYINYSEPVKTYSYFSENTFFCANNNSFNIEQSQYNSISNELPSKENLNKYKDMIIDDLYAANELPVGSDFLQNKPENNKSNTRRSSLSSLQIHSLPKTYQYEHISLKTEIKSPVSPITLSSQIIDKKICVPNSECTAKHPFSITEENSSLANDASEKDFQQWLITNRFHTILLKLQNFTTNDFLRLTKEDLIKIVTDTAEAIRCYNLAHNVQILPKLSIYVKFSGSNYFFAIYLDNLTHKEFIVKLNFLYQAYITEMSSGFNVNNFLDTHVFSNSITTTPSSILSNEYDVFLQSKGILIKITDDVLRNLKKESKYSISLEKIDLISHQIDFIKDNSCENMQNVMLLDKPTKMYRLVMMQVE